VTAVPLAHAFDGPEDAPVLVLANSVGSSPAMWDAQVPAFAQRFRVLRYDHRGHGASPVPPGPYAMDDLGADLLALLDALELERVAFCGLSMGGMVGMWVASEAPERIGRLALCCTSARLGPPEQWTDRAAAVRAGGMAAVVEAVVDRWLTPGFSAAHPDVRARLEAMLLSNPPEGYARCCEAIAAMDLFARLGRITAPTLVLSAEQDPATPPEHGDAIVACIPGARHVVLSDAAHLAPVERPEDVTAVLLEHLDPEAPR
jgi:3-oxoadipate enol-lactonase